ncbi:MAG: hypothetical protein LBU83_08560 [Bacteroidales bacterium]|jgi:hypothetical protein|nr:hypothetical protein [Bacteroidales bacterium]
MALYDGIDEKDIIWEERVSGKGNKYEVGYLEKPSGDAKKESSDGKEDFGITCNWYPTDNFYWIDTETGFKKVSGITRYSVHKHDGNYSYIIEFTNNENYDYKFYDETGDYYGCNCFLKRNHWVRYNSSKPRIIFVRGD